MSSIAPYEPLKDSDARCAVLVTMAERELSAFVNAVSDLFGSEQAEISAEEWLQELIEIDGLPGSPLGWRMITARVSTRLASRVNASSLSTELTNL